MGIPHLITFLQPYAELEALRGHDVVIDGPAFAYHIYYICLGNRSTAQGPFDAIPSYEEIGDTAVRWLDGLTKSNATIKKIYFDGLLPPSKLTIRLGRLVALTTRMAKYYAEHPTCNIPASSTPVTRTSPFAPSALRSTLTSIPALPLLVPAVFAALKDAKSYADITQVVPGEADSYCSKYLSKYGGLVLTADSDLLAHDLGPNGSVGFFRTVQESPPAPSGELMLLECEIYRPATIAKRLSLPGSKGILSLAFEMVMDVHGTFPQLLWRAKTSHSAQKHEKLYDKFRREYILPVTLSDVSQPTVAVLRGLDARISEYVLQFPYFLDLAGGRMNTFSSTAVPRVFLPFLLDCADKTNAWEMSTSIRQLAYGLINTVVPESQRKSTIFEHRKQQDNSNGRELQLPNISQISDACRSTIDMLSMLREQFSHLSGSEFWVAVAVYQDVDWSHANSKSSISTAIGSQSGPGSNWDIIQLIALIEGSFYSFRMLKQIVELVLATRPARVRQFTLVPLYAHLEKLPGPSKFKGIRHSASIVHLLRSSKICDNVSEMLNIKALGCDEITIVVKNKRRKRNKVDVTPIRKSNNLFDVLDIE